MKITDKELGILYRLYVDDRSPASRQICPNPEDLISIFNPRARKKRKTQIIDHITRCSACTNEFRLFLEIERERKQFESKIGIALSESHNPLKKKARLLGKMFISLGFWQYATMAVGMIFFTMSFLTLFQKNPFFSSKPAVARIQSQPAIQLIEPVRGSISKSRLVFKWQPVPFANYYVFELYDEALKLVWKSPNFSETSLIVPKGILEKLNSLKPHFWMVTVYLQSGKYIESSLAGFLLLE
jgi:hypothetical protein